MSKMVIKGVIAKNGVAYYYENGVRIPKPKSNRKIVWKKTRRVRPNTAVRRRTRQTKVKLPKEIEIPEQLSLENIVRKVRKQSNTETEDLKLEINGIAFASGADEKGVYLGKRYSLDYLRKRLNQLRKKYGNVPSI